MNNKEDLFEGISIELLVNFAKTADIIEEVFAHYYKKFQLSKPQFNALYAIYLSGDDGITLSALGDRMFVTRANITSLIDRMEARGTIKRIMNPEDRRSIKAVITDKGKEILSKVLPNNKIFSSDILGFLTDAEKTRANELLLRIQKELVQNYLEN